MRYRGTRKALVLSSMMALASLVATTTSPAAAAPPASSASSSEKTRAAELFKKGSEAYMKGDFTTAIANLEEAYKIDPQPVLVYNRARAHEGLGHTDEAIKLYEQYLQEEPSSPDRGAIEQRLATLKKQRDEKAASDAERARLEKERRERENAPPPPPKKHSQLPYVVGGVGVAGLAAGVVFGLMAKGKESDGESAKSQVDAVDARDSGQSLATVANVCFIAGGVLLAAGAVWWALDHGGGSKKTASQPPLQITTSKATIRLLGPTAMGGTF